MEREEAVQVADALNLHGSPEPTKYSRRSSCQPTPYIPKLTIKAQHGAPAEAQTEGKPLESFQRIQAKTEPLRPSRTLQCPRVGLLALPKILRPIAYFTCSACLLVRPSPLGFPPNPFRERAYKVTTFEGYSVCMSPARFIESILLDCPCRRNDAYRHSHSRAIHYHLNSLLFHLHSCPPTSCLLLLLLLLSSPLPSPSLASTSPRTLASKEGRRTTPPPKTGVKLSAANTAHLPLLLHQAI